MGAKFCVVLVKWSSKALKFFWLHGSIINKSAASCGPHSTYLTELWIKDEAIKDVCMKALQDGFCQRAYIAFIFVFINYRNCAYFFKYRNTVYEDVLFMLFSKLVQS